MIDATAGLRNKPLLKASLLFLLLFLASTFFVWLNSLQKERIYLQNATLYRKILLQSNQKEFTKLAQIIFKTKIHRPEILSIMDQANQAWQNRDLEQFATLHERLYRHLLPTYQFLKKYRLRQLHFHLPDAISFLRFHRPRKYGDSLKNIRTSIVQSQQKHRFVQCFEEGRIFNGFRNLFPLEYRGKFVGTVEISFDPTAMIDPIEKSLPLYGTFLLSKKVIGKKVWIEERGNYRPSKLLPGFYVDRSTITSSNPTSKRIYEELPSITDAFSHALPPRVRTTDLSFSFISHHTAWMATIIHLKNCAGKQVALFLFIEKNPFFQEARKSFFYTLLFLLALNALIAFFYYRNTTQRLQYEKRLSDLAMIDPLTKIGNRRYFFEAAAKLFAKSKRSKKPAALLFFDVDHFKTFNDTYGHEMGDLVLKKITETIANEIRKNDTFARWGGEEFTLLLEEVSLEEAIAIAQKIRKSIASLRIDEKLPKVTISIGVAVLEENESIEVWLKRADEALYRAKKEGRNRVVSAS